MNKADEELFRKRGKERLTLIHPGKNERKSIRNVLREGGFTDIHEFESFDDAWEKLLLSTTHHIVFPQSGGGEAFMQQLVESSRFTKSALLLFCANPEQCAKKLGSGVEGIVRFHGLPMNALEVEKALLSLFKEGVAVERSMVADENAALDKYTRGVTALNRGNAAEAKELFREALKENPEFFDAYVKMADALMELGEYEAAKKVLARADTLRPNHPKVLTRLVEITAETEGKERSVAMAEAASERMKNDPMGLVEVGNALLAKGYIEEAIAIYEKARNVDPNLIHVYNRLGIAYSRKKDFDGAKAMYDRALTIDAADAGIHFNLGMMFFRKGEKGEATRMLKKTVELDPDMGEAKEFLQKIEQQA